MVKSDIASPELSGNPVSQRLLTQLSAVIVSGRRDLPHSPAVDFGRKPYRTAKQVMLLDAIATFFEENEFGPRSIDIVEMTAMSMDAVSSGLRLLELKGIIVCVKDDIGGRCGRRITKLYAAADYGVWEETEEMRKTVVGANNTADYVPRKDRHPISLGLIPDDTVIDADQIPIWKPFKKWRKRVRR